MVFSKTPQFTNVKFVMIIVSFAFKIPHSANRVQPQDLTKLFYLMRILLVLNLVLMGTSKVILLIPAKLVILNAKNAAKILPTVKNARS